MSDLLRLFIEFFKTGLFSIGGGMATLPFLKEMGETTGWFTDAELMNMLAVSESTPGPIGINMATYIGFKVSGIIGGIIATVGEVTPSIIIIILIASALERFKGNVHVDRAFYGLRPASSGLITAAALGIILSVLFPGGGLESFFIPGLVFGAILFVLMNYVKLTKKLHPIVFIVLSAVAGIVFGWQ